MIMSALRPVRGLFAAFWLLAACGTVEPEEFRPEVVAVGAENDVAGAVDAVLRASASEEAREAAERVESLILNRADGSNRNAGEMLRVRVIRYAAELPEHRDANAASVREALRVFLSATGTKDSTRSRADDGSADPRDPDLDE